MVSLLREIVVIMLLFLAIAGKELPKLDEDQVSVIGWTEAHSAVYGWFVQGVEIPIDQVRSFLSQETDDFLCKQNDFGQTALHLAVRQNLLDVVQLYVERRICIDTPNSDGDTALHYAAVWGRLEATKYLLPVADIKCGICSSSKTLGQSCDLEDRKGNLCWRCF